VERALFGAFLKRKPRLGSWWAVSTVNRKEAKVAGNSKAAKTVAWILMSFSGDGKVLAT